METLELLAHHFELILFTAATQQYADVMLQTFEGHQYFDHILSRKHCWFIAQHQAFVKDLTILTFGRDLKDIVIVDNKVESYSSNLDNGIPIKSFYGDDNDNMLQLLQKYLMKLIEIDDVRI